YNTVTIDPNATLKAAADELAARQIGALVVLGPDRYVVGIISERDIVHAIARDGQGMLDQPVSSIMTRKVVTCGEHDTIASIMGWMTVSKFRHIPVVENGRLVGIVSIGDVVKHRLQEIESEAAALRDYIQTA